MIRPDEIIRSNRKTLAISVDPFGRLIVRAPKRCGEERIFAFIREKEGWILRQKAKMQGAGIYLPPENLNGYELLLLGKKYKIILTDTKRIVVDDENLYLFLPQEKPKEKLVKWIKENAKRIFTAVTKKMAERMQTTFKSVTVTSAKGRWGSCSFNNAIHYSFRLLYAPKEVVDYVVVHELAHTKHKNHSALFWNEVSKFIPDWKEKRAWLKNRGALMEIF